MNKIALINGKYEGQTLNIMITNDKVSGLGYIPEDKGEEIKVYDLKGLNIVPKEGEKIILFKKLNAVFVDAKENKVKGEVVEGQIKFIDL
ncbi:hypothetical protein HOC37_04535 [bacterium]|jgi:hypothetical protein|nr:hypothetical protein [bacterium]